MNITEALSIIPRSLGSLLTLFFVTKLMGKKQVSELSLFDYVIGISIGNFSAEVTMGLDKQYIDGLIAIGVFGIISWAVSKITMKSIILRRFIIGTPTVVIQKGKILEKSLKKLNIDINDLLEQCRSNGNFDISQIEYGIMEVNGKINILLKSQYNPVTPLDLNLKIEKQEIVANVIIDGKIMYNNLYNMKKNKEWLYKELKVKGYQLKDVLLATLDNNEKLNIYEKNIEVDAINLLE
jgi:uncharacterized membrane protein YcaP (DUF421 family)